MDPETLLEGFFDEILVVCPRCKGPATVREKGPTLRCPHCGASKEAPAGPMRVGIPSDPFFGLPLLLKKRVAGEVLWAYNRRHLAFLKEYVAATLRPTTPHRNASLVSRLPKWMKKAARRAAILKAVAALEQV